MDETRNNLLLWSWRCALWGAICALLLWLFWMNLVPSGELDLSYRAGDPASPVSEFHPEQRLIDLPEDGDAQRLYIDPVYFDVKVPREFDTVTATLRWRNESQPIIELGARSVRGAWGFVMKPLQNKIIDGLQWPCTRYDRVLFCQKEVRYANLTSFFSNPPESGVVSYHYVLPETITNDVMNVNTDVNDYDFLIATYVPPVDLGDGLYEQPVTYDWRQFALHINEISFILSAPQLNQGHGQIVVEDVSVLLHRDPLDWDGFWSYVKNQLKRLKK